VLLSLNKLFLKCRLIEGSNRAEYFREKNKTKKEDNVESSILDLAKFIGPVSLARCLSVSPEETAIVQRV